MQPGGGYPPGRGPPQQAYRGQPPPQARGYARPAAGGAAAAQQQAYAAAAAQQQQHARPNAYSMNGSAGRPVMASNAATAAQHHYQASAAGTSPSGPRGHAMRPTYNAASAPPRSMGAPTSVSPTRAGMPAHHATSPTPSSRGLTAKDSAPGTSSYTGRMPQLTPGSFPKLRARGFGDQEVLASVRKLNELVQSIDPHADLEPEVQEVLLDLSVAFVQEAAEQGIKLAKHRGSTELRLEDLRMFVEGRLGLHVPGFGSTLTGGMPASKFDNQRRNGPDYVPDTHAARLEAKRKAHVLLQDTLFVDNK